MNRIRRFRKAATALLLMCSAIPANAIAPDNKPADTKKLHEATNEALLQSFDAERTKDPRDYCGQLVPILSEMATREQYVEQAVGLLADANMWCAIDQGRRAEAYKYMIEAEELFGESYGALGFQIAAYARHYDAAVDRLALMAAAKNSAELLDNTDKFFAISHDLTKEGKTELRSRMFEALFASPHFEKFDDDTRSGIASNLLDDDAKRGDFSRAARLIAYLNSPDIYSDLLANRRYEKIWPAIESAVGPNLRTVSSAQVNAAQFKFDADKSNRKAFQQLANALLSAGEFEKVVALVGTYDHGPAGIAALTEDDAWALNAEAYALDGLGKTQAADEVFEAIAAIPYDADKNRWLVNFTINRALRLLEWGKWQQGLDAALLAEQITVKSGSDFAKMLVRKAKVCALSNLNRRAEIPAILEEIYEKRKDSYSTAAEAMLCGSEDDRAAAIVIEALGDPNNSSEMIGQLQKPEWSFYTESRLPRLRERLLDRPDIRVKYNQLARDIPDAFLPLASKRWIELKDARSAP